MRALKRLAVAVLGLLMISSPAAANQPRGITVVPPFQEVVLNGPQISAPVPIKVINTTKAKQTFRVQAVDFRSLDESGGVAFLGSRDSDIGSQYRLAQYLQLPSGSITLEPGQTQTITAQAVNSESLAPGGHYGAILFTADSAGGRGGDNPVAFRQVLSSLIFLKKTGGEKYDLKVNSLKTTKQWRRPTQNLAVQFRNEGNVHVVPRGTIKLISPTGKVVSKGIINHQSSYILPETNRQYPSGLEGQSFALIPGKYKLEVSYRYDGSEEYQTFVQEINFVNLVAVGWTTLLLGVLLVFHTKINKVLARAVLGVRSRIRGQKSVPQPVVEPVEAEPAKPKKSKPKAKSKTAESKRKKGAKKRSRKTKPKK